MPTVNATIELRHNVFASRPASGALGEAFFATDTGALYIWNGSSWAQVGGGGSAAGSTGQMQGNNSGAFAGVAGTVLDFTNGTIEIAPPTGAAGVAALTVTGDSSGVNDCFDVFTNDDTLVLQVDTLGNVVFNGITFDTNGDLRTSNNLICNGPILLGDNLFDVTSSSGTSGQLLSRASGGGVQWITPAYVPASRTVNGHALSGNIVISASDLTTGTLPHAQLPTLVSGDIPNNAANTSGTAAGLSAAITESQVTSLVSDLASKVATTVTVNGHALSGNIVISASDLTTGTLPHGQLPALVSGDIPNNGANTSGTAGGLSASIAESQVTNLVSDLAAKVPTTVTVNGHALSSNVTVSASDLSTGTLPQAQLPVVPNANVSNGLTNFNTSAQSQVMIAGTQYYMTNSNLNLPASLKTGIVAGTTLTWHVVIGKTGQGIGLFSVILFTGTNGTTSDTASVTQGIGTASTAAVDSMILSVQITFLTTGSNGSFYWSIAPVHCAASGNGFGAVYGTLYSGTVSSFNTTTASLVFGLGFQQATGGTLPTVTIPVMQAYAFNLV